MVTRYNRSMDEGKGHIMDESETGEWVRHEDYAKLEAERDELKDRLESALITVGKYGLTAENNSILDVALTARRELNKLREKLSRRDIQEPVIYGLIFKNSERIPDKEINTHCFFRTYKKASEYAPGGNYVTQSNGKIIWVSNPELNPVVVPLYIAPPAAVLPPELTLENVDSFDFAVDDASDFVSGANWMRMRALELGCQPVKEVVLLSKSCSVILDKETLDGFTRHDIAQALQKAGIKWREAE